VPSPRLTNDEIRTRLARVPRWKQDGDKIRREWKLADFAACFAFMTRIAAIAERREHHPDWSNSYSKLTIELTSHDVGGLSRRDFDMAEEIDALGVD
jgi:4a-hydroxytetrahydrobiopterin dehydratase